MATSLGRDLIFLIMQFLDEEKYKDVLHKLEQESGIFFNFKHFEELVLAGNWDETEKYLSGFTRIDDNRYSMKIYFELRKQKYLETLDRNDRARAVDILAKDLKIFAAFNEDLFKEMTQLLTLDNFRENEQLASYRDTRSARAVMVTELKKLIDANPIFRDKMQFPAIRHSRLRMLINQSLNWQHSLCPNPRPNPDIKTLFVDHICRNPNNESLTQLSASNQLALGSAQKPDGGFLAIGTPGSLQPSPSAIQTPLSTWMSTATMGRPVASSAGALSLISVPANPVAIPKAPVESSEAALQKRIPGASERVLLPATNPIQSLPPVVSNWTNEFPTSVARVLVQASAAMSMDFHPLKQTLLLVGTNVGEISLWEVSSREKLATRSYQVGVAKDPSVSVKRVLWTHDGSLFGAAFSKNTLQLYRYHGGTDIRKHLEFEAHVGSVNDLAFCNPNKQLCIITCGDDKLIKVWDVALGTILYAFEGHSAPVTSVCPHNRENVHYLFSTSVDGKIKAWLYDLDGSRVDYDAPGRACTTMCYTADGKRLFSCGTTKDGECHIVEWNENEGTVKRAYQGFHKHSSSVVQFDITKNRFLAVGDDYSIKVWDIDNVNLLTTIDAEGDLPASPCIRFNKAGTLMAVSANDNKIKILATVDGLRLLQTCENRSFMAPRIALETTSQNGIAKEGKSRSTEEANATKTKKPVEISEPAHLQSLRLTAPANLDKISRLIFTNSGTWILALAQNGVHLIWKWARCEHNLSGKATTKVAPLLAQPTSGSMMTNDFTNVKPEDSFSCFALSKNDSYVMSASGGKISLFNMMSCKTMTSFMPPPPVATCLAFHPQDNNIVAVGMDDSTIRIYNVRIDQVKNQLIGHSKRITGLAFSSALKILVSAGADSQLMIWGSEGWEKKKSCFLDIPGVRSLASTSNTQVQFHPDQTHLLVVHEVLLSIFDASKLHCTKQWVPGDSSPPIMQAVFSSDGHQAYAIFGDGIIRVFDTANLHPHCLINPASYLPPNVMSAGTVVPNVVAAHPHEANLLAVGLSDGGVVVLEPLESDGKWAAPPTTPPPPPPAAAEAAENGAAAPAADPQPMSVG